MDYLFAWNGENDNGDALPFDVYAYRLIIENCNGYKIDEVSSVLVLSNPTFIPIFIIPNHIPSVFNPNCCQTCKTLSSNTYGSKIFQTSNCIIAQDNFNVIAGQDIVFDAGESIQLKPGVKVTLGGRLLCKTGGCSIGSGRMAAPTIVDTMLSPQRPLDSLFHFTEDKNIISSNERISNTTVGVFPPVDENTTIYYSFDTKEIVIISIYSIYGTLLNQIENYESFGAFNFDFSHFPSGIYIVTFTSQNYQETLKVVKN